MPVTTRKPLLLGRERDIAELDEALALAAQGSPQTVLVGGDAGIGKTTLVADLERRAGELGFTVATGHGLDIEAGISFAPVTEAVRSLLSEVEDLQSRPCARRMLTLLDPDTPRSREAFRVLDELTAAVLEAAAAGPVLLVLEDMHWADRSTQDFATALSRTARGRLLLVLTFRSDELHRGHPFRKTLTEVSRASGSRRLDLGPLDRDDIAGIVAARTDGSPEPSVVDAVLARSEGNPLYAEELLAADTEGVPGHLSDLLLARIDALDQGPRALLRVASVNGTRLDTETLVELAALDQAQMECYLREALDANVLRQSGGSLEFRHPLLREAAYDDLMPDERTRIHARLAEVLQTRVDAEPDPGLAILSRLAFHWNAAHDLPRTLTASVRAGLVAKRLGAAEAITQLERALSLWDRVPDADAVAHHPRVEIVIVLAEAAGGQEDEERGHALVHAAVEMLGPDPDRLLASRVYSALALASRKGDEIGKPEAIRLAVAYAGDSPTEHLARALIVRSLYLNRHTQFAASAEAAQRAVDAAMASGCVEAEVDALYLGSLSLFYLGHIADALAGMERSRAVARAAGIVWQVLDGCVPVQYMEAGRVDHGLSMATEGFDEGMALGLPVQAGGSGGAALKALLWRGRLDEAEQRLEEFRELGVPTFNGRWSIPLAELRLARGDTDAALPLVREITIFTESVGRTPWDTEVLTELELAAMLDDRAAAFEAARSYLVQLDDCDSPLTSAGAARIAFQALCLGRTTLEARTDELRELAARQLTLARRGLTDEWRPTYHGVQLALAEAYSARYAEKPAATQFREATALAEPFGAYFALEPRLNLATELLTHGGRDEGRELLVECWRAADEMGAHDLERRAVRLATRTRVPLPRAAAREGPLSRLTPREREVLELLAIGATNKTIATSLFVTDKTASAHVSNILAKLGVANRGEAAALARRLVG
ncbi:helix-turn-helix transcriptional regulator [Nocardioides sp.]|uniref:helix-turn-helix transcriptional regulator n=1 Tax=Nocardioides sp. TaxID=35761 RepID=UPI002F40347A